MKTIENGVFKKEERVCSCDVLTVDILTPQAAEKLGKDVGRYITIYADGAFDGQATTEKAGECLAEMLAGVLQPYFQKKLCICGIGNRYVIADALGPEVVYTLPLKFLSSMYAHKGNFKDITSFCPGAAMTNNMNTEDLVAGIVKATETDCLLLVDSLVTTDSEKLLRTIQVSTAGGTNPYLSEHIADWSGVNVPIISLGIPVAMPADLFLPHSNLRGELLTSTKIQDHISSASTIIAYAIMRVCWPTLSKEECFVYSKMMRDPTPYSAIFDVTEENSDVKMKRAEPSQGMIQSFE